MHIFKNRLKVLIRTKVMIFWTLLFPIALATLFNIAFSNIMSSEKFKPIEIGIVNNDAYQQSPFKEIINNTSSNNDKQIFKTKYYKNEKQATNALKNNKIIGYYVIHDKINIIVKKNGFNQTIMKYVSDSYYQNYSMMNHIMEFNPTDFKAELISELNSNNSYFNDNKVNNLDITVVYFYSLIGMVCLYGGFFGVNAVNETEANLSKKAARLAVAPTNKMKTLLSSLFAGFIVQFIEVIILFLYLLLVLRIDFGTKIPYIILIIFIGSLSGITLGTFIGVSNKKSENMKTGIVISVAMILSFLSGLMMQDIKYIIDTKVPLLSKINPVSMITDGLYSLYYYNDLNRYFNSIFSLLIFSIIMISLSYMFVRRKKYDSI